jgi:hypothetical protein
VWPRSSAETTRNSIATDEGAITSDGVTKPTAWTVKVAGSRTPLAPLVRVVALEAIVVVVVIVVLAVVAAELVVVAAELVVVAAGLGGAIVAVEPALRCGPLVALPAPAEPPQPPTDTNTTSDATSSGHRLTP